MGTGVAAIIANHDNRLRELPVDILIVAEAAVITGNVTELAKYSFARERPYVHYRSPSEREAQKKPSDNLSFFSGHSSLAFSLAVSAGNRGLDAAAPLGTRDVDRGARLRDNGRLPPYRCRSALRDRRANGRGGRLSDRLRRSVFLSRPTPAPNQPPSG